jgi:pilus assembly protein TadC
MSLRSPVLSLAALAAALLLWVPPGALRQVRVRALAQVPGRVRRVRSGDPPGRGRRAVGAVVAGLAVTMLCGGGLAGVLVGAGAAVAAERGLRGAGASAASAAGGLRRELPAACDLLAVCLAAGTPVGAAIAAVAAAVPGPLGDHLTEVGALYRLGAAPGRAWAAAPAELDGLGRTLVRAGQSGSSVVPALERLAGDLRTAQRSEVEAAVRRAGVWVLAPLGVCFLPAFLCLGVVPMVLGIAADVFG